MGHYNGQSRKAQGVRVLLRHRVRARQLLAVVMLQPMPTDWLGKRRSDSVALSLVLAPALVREQVLARVDPAAPAQALGLGWEQVQGWASQWIAVAVEPLVVGVVLAVLPVQQGAAHSMFGSCHPSICGPGTG